MCGPWGAAQRERREGVGQRLQVGRDTGAVGHDAGPIRLQGARQAPGERDRDPAEQRGRDEGDRQQGENQQMRQRGQELPHQDLPARHPGLGALDAYGVVPPGRREAVRET